MYRSNRKVIKLRKQLIARQLGLCWYCGGQIGRRTATLDHVVPRSKGGPTSEANCVAACWPCNRDKADRMPEPHEMPTGEPQPSVEQREIAELYDALPAELRLTRSR